MSTATSSGVECLRLSHRDYRAYPAVSQSELKAAWNNPQLYYETHIARTRPMAEPTEAMQWGTNCETYLRYGHLPGVMQIPDGVLNDQGHRKGKRWTDFAAQFSLLQLLKADEFDELMDGFRSSAMNVTCHKFANLLVLEAGEFDWQRQYTWYDADADLPMKGELDIVRDDLRCIVDIKTSSDVREEPFARKVVELGYDIQAATYTECMRRHTGRQYAFAWVVIRNKPPYDVEVYEATDDLLAIGERRLAERVEWFRQCRDTGVWRSPTHGLIQSLYPPRWLRGVL